MVYPVVHGDLDPHWALAEGRAVGAPPKHRSPGHSVLSATAPRFELARQPFVLLRHIEQTCAGFWNHFFVGPLADLIRLLTVMRHALQVGVPRPDGPVSFTIASVMN